MLFTYKSTIETLENTDVLLFDSFSACGFDWARSGIARRYARVSHRWRFPSNHGRHRHEHGELTVACDLHNLYRQDQQARQVIQISCEVHYKCLILLDNAYIVVFWRLCCYSQLWQDDSLWCRRCENDQENLHLIFEIEGFSWWIHIA